MEDEAYDVVNALSEYIESTGLNYVFIQAITPQSGGFINQTSAYGSRLIKSDNEWQIIKD